MVAGTGVGAMGQAGAPAAPGSAPTAAPASTPSTGGAGGTSGGAGGSGQQGQVKFDELPPALKLGARAGIIQQRIPVSPTVVIVNDAQSYAQAIGSWSIQARFPVLFDDGTMESAERIARFVRAFEPRTVLHISPEDSRAPWPGEEMQKRAAIEDTAASAWRDSEARIDRNNLKTQWERLQFQPIGVVLADATDPTWTAALALAAGRGQPIVWGQMPKGVRGDINGVLTAEQARDLSTGLEDAIKGLGLEYEKLGDQIDALTICMNGPIKVFPGGADKAVAVALTDSMGRTFDATGQPKKQRWAWCGQIVGNESQAAYMAMCSLFMPTKHAWLFDAYESGDPWNQFDLTTAATFLEKVNITTMVDDVGRQGLADWRKRAAGVGFPARTKPGEKAEANAKPAIARGVDAQFIAVNSSGNPDYFDLKPGQGRPADVPFLRTPAAVYMVHSWSAATMANAETVGGRWLQRGAYAYVGSVHEPFLQGFVNTPTVTARLASGAPWGAAVRFEESGVWKIVTLGDPLMRIRGEPKRLETPLELKVGKALSEELAEDLRSRDFASAFRALTMLGRDQDLARLVLAMLDDPAQKLTPALAVQALPSLYFAGDSTTFARAFKVALPSINAEAMTNPSRASLLDLPWHMYAPMLTTLTREEATLLQQSVRGLTKDRDMKESMDALTNANERK